MMIISLGGDNIPYQKTPKIWNMLIESGTKNAHYATKYKTNPIIKGYPKTLHCSHGEKILHKRGKCRTKGIHYYSREGKRSMGKSSVNKLNIRLGKQETSRSKDKIHCSSANAIKAEYTRRVYKGQSQKLVYTLKIAHYCIYWRSVLRTDILQWSLVKVYTVPDHLHYTSVE